MADYIDAIGSGISAAKQAVIARTEIEQVIKDASSQISDATKSLLVLRLTEEEKVVTGPNQNNFQSMAESIKSAYLQRNFYGRSEVEKIKYMALSICHKNIKEKAVLCTWIEDKDGYPVKLQFSRKEITCRDKRSLEGGIIDLLSDSSIGDLIQKLLDKTSIEIIRPNIGLADHYEDL